MRICSPEFRLRYDGFTGNRFKPPAPREARPKPETSLLGLDQQEIDGSLSFQVATRMGV